MLEITAAATDPREVDADRVVVPVFKGGIEGPGAALVLAACGLERFPVTPDFRGDIGQHLLLSGPGITAGGILLVGLGRMSDVDAERLRQAAGVAAAASGTAARIATTLAEVHATDAAAQAVAEGLHLGAGRDHGLQTAQQPPASQLREAVVLVPSSRLARARQAVAHAGVHAKATLAARDLVDRPPDRKRPDALAAALTELAAGSCTSTVRTADELAGAGFGGLLAVGASSTVAPRMVELRYQPPDPMGHVVVVGHGITFDSGGLGLKRGTRMDAMKASMAGAAAVTGACSVLGDLDVRLTVTALCPLAETLPSEDAPRPGDIVRLHGGHTVELRDPGAQSQLVLGEAVAYARSLQPEAIVDVASLTDAAALGSYAAGVMGNDPELVQTILGAASVAGEDAWQLPLWARWERELNSTVADTATAAAGPRAITAGLFLQRFAATASWAHLDIAGPAHLADTLAEGYLPAGGTGFGVRTLLAWLERSAW